MVRRCPWCCERLPHSSRREGLCPMCGHNLYDERGRELKRLDLRYEELKEAQEKRFRGLETYGSVVAAVAGLAIGFVHIAAAILVPVMIVGHMLAVRFALMMEACTYMGTSRRLITRWILRLGIFWGGAIGYGAAVVPVAGSVFSVVTFAGLTWLAHQYILWGLVRERNRKGTTIPERVLLVALALATAVAVITMVVLAALIGWTGDYLFELVRTR